MHALNETDKRRHWRHHYESADMAVASSSDTQHPEFMQQWQSRVAQDKPLIEAGQRATVNMDGKRRA